MTILHVSEKHQYDEVRGVVIYQNQSEKPYDCISVKIDIYEARVKGWFLDVARTGIGAGAGDYVAFMVALSYFEGVEQYFVGEDSDRKSGKFFKEGVKKVFPQQKSAVTDLLWKGARCGLFHAGFTKEKIHLSHDDDEAIKRDGDFIRINPRKFLDCVSEHHRKFVSDLRNPSQTDLRKNFEKRWDELWKNS